MSSLTTMSSAMLDLCRRWKNVLIPRPVLQPASTNSRTSSRANVAVRGALSDFDFPALFATSAQPTAQGTAHRNAMPWVAHPWLQMFRQQRRAIPGSHVTSYNRGDPFKEHA